MNGRRTPFANQELTGTITGLTLGSLAPQIFKALVEATAFGSKAIVEQMRKEGVRIDNIIGIGGIPLKSPLCDADAVRRAEHADQSVPHGAGLCIGRSHVCRYGSRFLRAGGGCPGCDEPGFDREYAPDAANAENMPGCINGTWKSAILTKTFLRNINYLLAIYTPPLMK